VRTIEIVNNTRLAIQSVAPVGCDDSTIIISSQDGVSTVHRPPMKSTPWGRIVGYENCSLSDIRCVVRGVQAAFRSRTLRLINAVYFLELGLQATNDYIGTFLWVSGLEAILMAGNSVKFRDRLVNILGAQTFIFPSISPSGQPKYRVAEIAEDLYEFRSAIARGQLISKKFLAVSGLIDTNGVEISSYPPHCQYWYVLHECALFLLTAVLRKIFLEHRIRSMSDTTFWRARLDHPF
jgi:hypothetical protein